MITAASLKSQTVKDLAQMAKRLGVDGWHGMRKEQLIRALVRAAKLQQRARVSASGSLARGVRPAVRPARRTLSKVSPGDRRNAPVAERPAAATRAKSPRVARRIQEAHAARENRKDLSRETGFPLSLAPAQGESEAQLRAKVKKDGIVVLVRDPFWLQACWEVLPQSVQRARAAMAERWHTARPVLRLMEVDGGPTTSTSERVVEDIEIHAGVRNWFIPVTRPPRSFRVDLGYLSSDGRFHAIARSNSVTTPHPGSADAVDRNWADVAENYEKIYALSGGYTDESAAGELQEMFEERLRRPMGTPSSTSYGVGAEQVLNRHRDFGLEIDAELVVHGRSKPDAHICLAGEPVKLRTDGSFSVRMSLPDRRQVFPIVASSGDGAEQRTIVMAVERNTKIMEPMVRETGE